MVVCKGDLTNPCLRELWSTLPAISFLALLIAFSLPIPLPRPVAKFFAVIRAPFLPTLTVSEAQELEHQFALEDSGEARRSEQLPSSNTAPRWRSALFVFLALVEFVAWLVVGVVSAIRAIRNVPASRSFHFLPYIPLLVSFTWAFALARLLHRPPKTPPYDLFILFILHLAGGVLNLAGQLYTARTSGTPFPSDRVIAAESVHLGILVVLLVLIVSLPLNEPIEPVDEVTVVSHDNLIIIRLLLMSNAAYTNA